VLIGAFFAAFAALIAMPIRMTVRWLATRGQRARAKAKRVVILGMDGMDPELAARYMAEGKLPTSSGWPRKASSGRSSPRPRRCRRSPGRAS
jgi:hypothetical protein